MGYLHIPNLYKDKTILLFKECYALEKIHGTSAHIRWDGETLSLYSGGEKHSNFEALFDGTLLPLRAPLEAALREKGYSKLVVYGELYGGKQQRQAWRYGPQLRFVAFEVELAKYWCNVPAADEICQALGIPFVHYERVSTDLAALDAQRDAPSVQSVRNGVTEVCPREGVVLRPLLEFCYPAEHRILAKHKRPEERETRTDHKVGLTPEVLAEGKQIALEWVTPTRLEHVLDKLPKGTGADVIPAALDAMVEDVYREGAGMVVPSRHATKEIRTLTAKMILAGLEASVAQ
ncbi:MAG TPA: RNA ligase family protein, partial [Candidatus Paceibacterota bacterium]